MANDIQKFFSGHQLPDAGKLNQALAGLAASKTTMSGKALLKLKYQTGEWLCGQDNEVMPEGTRLIVDPGSLQTGYIAWWKSEVEDEKMQLATLGPVDPKTLGDVNSGTIPPKSKEVSGKGWENQLAIDMITEKQPALALIYKTSTMGGIEAMQSLCGRMYIDREENPQRMYAIVELYVSSYTRKETRNTIYKPVFTVVGWLDAEGKPVRDMKSLL